MPLTPRKRKAHASTSPQPRRPPPRMEFRAPSDGAWYSARAAVQCGALRVMYEEFLEDQDDWYEPARLAASAHGVAELGARFRVSSPPVDDSRCRDVRPGDRLCVSCALDGGELKFYDAVLGSVSPAAPAHETVDGEEQCTCRFTVRWKQGPRKGSSEEVGVERVCRVLSSPLQDPVLDEFLDGVTKLLGIDNKSASASQAMGSSEAADVGARDAPPGFHHQYGARM